MAEYSGFFNAKELETGGYDREYDAEQFADYFSRFISNGVFGNPANNLQVVYSNSSEKPFNVTIKKGSAFIEGYWYELTEDMEVEIPANTQATQAMHTICCTLDKQERKVYVRLKENVVSDLPERTENVFDLVLSRIIVQSNASKLNASDMTDRRANNDYCGFVVGLVSQIDTTDLFNQYDSAFNEWFQKMKDQLTEDAAGNLQNQIDAIKTDVETNETGIETLSNSFIETAAEVFSNTEQKKIASALAVKGLADYAPMLPRKSYSGDFNDMQTGVFVSEISKCTNVPPYSSGMWVVTICYSKVVQITFHIDATIGSRLLAYRNYNSNVWQPWVDINVGFSFSDVWKKGTIKDALLVDLNNPNGENNKTAFVANWNSGTKNLPSDCACGVREVSWVTGPIVMVRITGYTVNTDIPTTWVNIYVNGRWLGWSRQTYGTGQLISTGISINSNRCSLVEGGYYVQNKMAHIQLKIKITSDLGSKNYWVMLKGLPQPKFTAALAITKYKGSSTAVGAYVDKTTGVASGEILITTAGEPLSANIVYVITGDYVVA